MSPEPVNPTPAKNAAEIEVLRLKVEEQGKKLDALTKLADELREQIRGSAPEQRAPSNSR